MAKIHRIRKERFEVMAIRVAAHLTESSPVISFEQIPTPLKMYFELLTYCELIRPLVHHDKDQKGKTIQELSISYGVSIQQIRTILLKKSVVF